jgi:hypothetical protein
MINNRVKIIWLTDVNISQTTSTVADTTTTMSMMMKAVVLAAITTISISFSFKCYTGSLYFLMEPAHSSANCTS